MKTKKRKHTAFDDMYTKKERETNIRDHTLRMHLFQILQRRNPKLCKIPGLVYSVIDEFIPDDFYERYAKAAAIEFARERKRKVTTEKVQKERIRSKVTDLLKSPKHTACHWPPCSLCNPKRKRR